MDVDSVKSFLEFRKKFTKREWFELNQAVSDQENKRADQIRLDDSDIKEIFTNIYKSKFISIPKEGKLEFLLDASDDLDIWEKSKDWRFLQIFQCLDRSFL